MKRNTINSLVVKFWATIETPPLNSREQFRQSVIDTILKVLKLQNINIEYIGYRPDKIGNHNTNSMHTVYEDCVFVSMNNYPGSFHKYDDQWSENIASDLIKVFEDKTHRHLQIDTSSVDRKLQQRSIEMTSDWKYYLKHA